MAEVNLGEVLAGYGITADLDDDEFLTSPLVLAKVHKADGGTSLLIACAPDVDWVDQFGLVTAAMHVFTSSKIG